MQRQYRNKRSSGDCDDAGSFCVSESIRRSDTSATEKSALSAIMATMEVGLPLEAIAIAIERGDSIDADVLARLKADFKESAGKFIEQQVRDSVSVIPTTEHRLIREHQERRRNVIRGFRENAIDAIWNRAIAMVRDRPEDALTIFKEGGDRSEDCVAMIAQGMVGRAKGMERRYAAVKTRVSTLAKELADHPDLIDVNQLDNEEHAHLLAYLAARQFGGAPTLLVATVAGAITTGIGYHMTLIILDDAKQYATMVERYIADGKYARRRLAIAEAATLPLWGAYQPLIEFMGRTPHEDWPVLANTFVESNGLATRLCDEFERTAKEARQQRSAAERETTALIKRMKAAERELAEFKKRAAKAPPERANVPTEAVQRRPTKQDAELAELRKTNARLQQRLEEQGVALTNTRALLDSLINQPAPAQKDAPPMTEKDFRDLKGVVVGGHINMIGKLRKVMPNCLFYSTEHKRVDEAAARDRDFMIFFTSHCNHCLSDNALRLSRLYDIPTGYSGHVNVDMFLADVAAILGRRTV